MTFTQWYYEFFALQAEEERRMKEEKEMLRANAILLRETLIGVLGLRFAKPKEGQPELPVTEQIEPFLPLSFLLAEGERLKEAQNFSDGEASASRAIKDEAFDKMAARLEADMVPIISLTADELKARRRKREQEEHVRQAKSLGIIMEDRKEPELKLVNITSIE